MNKNFLIGFVLLISLSFLLYPAVGLAATSQITISGEAVIVGGNIKLAKERAIEDACKKATRRAIGVFVKNNPEISNKIHTVEEQYKQYVEYKIIRENQDGGIYYVAITASVLLDKIQRDISQIVKAMNRQLNFVGVTFGVVIFDIGGDRISAIDIIDPLATEFANIDFRTVSKDKALELSEKVDKNLGKEQIHDNILAEMTKEAATFVVSGDVSILEVLKNTITNEYEVTVRSNIGVDDLDYRREVAKCEEIYRATAMVEQKAKEIAIHKAGINLARSLAGKTLAYWDQSVKEGRPYQIEICNVNTIRQQEQFMDFLGKYATIIEQYTQDNVVIVVIKSKKNKSQIITDFMEKFLDLDQSIVSGNRIKFTL